MEYYAVIKKNKDTLCVLIWNILQDVLLSGKLKGQKSGCDVPVYVFLKYI